MIKLLKLLLLFFVVAPVFLFSQPRLVITPNEIEFKDTFHRLGNAYFINTGTEDLVIDSIVYNYSYYFVRFDKYLSYPLTLSPGDTIQMDCILAGYYYPLSADTLDAMYVYSNSIDSTEAIKIKVDYYYDKLENGTISGQVTDGGGAIAGARISFLYAGNYLIQTMQTDQNGYYSAILPAGSYKISAEKTSYYVTFFGQQTDPLSAKFLNLPRDSIRTADIVLLPVMGTSNSVSGRIYDLKSNTLLRKAMVVVRRRGGHTPTKAVSDITEDSVDVAYTAFVNDDGIYSIDNIAEGNYYIQSFSDYFVPSYYSSSGTSPTFWQEAESVFIDSISSDVNIYMPRDSSIGGGSVSGNISITSSTGDTISDVIVYAQSVNSGSSVFNYAFSNRDGKFKIPFLPYGDYRLVAQKIGYNDGYSSEFTIDMNNKDVENLDITMIPASVKGEHQLPGNHVLLYNYPNPFNPNTTIEFYLPFSSYIELKIFDVLGKEITTLQKDYLSAGVHKIDFNANELTSGVYFVTLNTKETLRVRKILLLK